ncbi:MAG: glycosyltransferase family 4 protein [Lentisphaerota bacterium]
MNVLIPVFKPFYLETVLSIHVQHLAQTLVEAGWQVDLLVFSEEGACALPGVGVTSLFGKSRLARLASRSLVLRGILNILLFFRALGMCCARRYQVVHVLGESAFLAVLLKRFFRARLVYDLNASIRETLRRPGLHMLKPFWLRLERFLIRAADRVLSPCGILTELTRADVPGLRIDQIESPPLYPAFREDREGAQRLRQELGIGTDRVILYGGNFSGCQGIELLIKAARPVLRQHEALRFVALGVDYCKIKWLSTMARSLDLQGRFIFLSKRPLAELPAFMTLADILVSVRTSGLLLPLELITYMQTGKPLVATRTEVHTQLLTDEEAILVMPHADDIAEGLARALTPGETLKNMGMKSRSLVASRFSLASFKHRIRGLYQELQP